jgi:hypothetical protein
MVESLSAYNVIPWLKEDAIFHSCVGAHLYSSIAELEASVWLHSLHRK